MRPSTARRRPPKLKEAGQEAPPPREESKATPVGIILDGESSDDDGDDNSDDANVESGLAGAKRLADNLEVNVSKKDRHGKLVQEILRQQEAEMAQAKGAECKPKLH